MFREVTKKHEFEERLVMRAWRLFSSGPYWFMKILNVREDDDRKNGRRRNGDGVRGGVTERLFGKEPGPTAQLADGDNRLSTFRSKSGLYRFTENKRTCYVLWMCAVYFAAQKKAVIMCTWTNENKRQAK